MPFSSKKQDAVKNPNYFEDCHPIFKKFETWEGNVPKHFDVTLYGSFIRRSFYGKPDHQSERFHKRTLPQIQDDYAFREPGEYFELVDLLESIDSAKENFTIVELGAGWGKWMVQAAVIIKKFKKIPFKLIGVEAEVNHYQMMLQHFIDNGLNPDDHRLIQAAVNVSDKTCYFTQGNSKEWWGQAIVPSKDANFGDWPSAKIEECKGISLNTILTSEKYVDLMDMDIQGIELDVIRESLLNINSKVKRIRIATHGNKIERDIYDILSKDGWVCCTNFSVKKNIKTPYGILYLPFDGIQTWINPFI